MPLRSAARPLRVLVGATRCLVLAASVGATAPAHADVAYHYLGSFFDQFGDETPPAGSYDASMRLEISLSFAQPLPPDADVQEFKDDVLASTFEDGRHVVTDPELDTVRISTDAQGAITAWEVDSARLIVDLGGVGDQLVRFYSNNSVADSASLVECISLPCAPLAPYSQIDYGTAPSGGTWDGNDPTVPFEVIQVTQNDTDDRYAAVSGSSVVWQGCDGTTNYSVDPCDGDYEIYLWDGSFPVAPIPITDNDVDDLVPAISGSKVVWWSSDGHDSEVFYWDGTFPIVPVQITDNDVSDRYPAISGSHVTWEQCDAASADDFQCLFDGDYEIYYWDGSFPIVPLRLTDDTVSDRRPAISGSKVVWQSRGPGDQDYDIQFWDGSEVHQLTDDTVALDWMPDIWGSTVVVWVGPGGILRWTGGFPVVPTSIGSCCRDPAVSGSRVLWQKGPALNTNIWLWDGTAAEKVSRTVGFENANPDVSSSVAVWDGCLAFQGVGSCLLDREIYMVSFATPVPSASPTAGALLLGLMFGTAILFGGKRRLRRSATPMRWPKS